jgi:hypothetical protein
MRIITIVNVVAAVLLMTTFSASAQKAKSGWCDQNACVAACNKNGGQGRLCPQYCEKRIREDKRCK